MIVNVFIFVQFCIWLVAFYSALKMISYLQEKKIINSLKDRYWNYLFFIPVYIIETQDEIGKIGKWFYIFLFCILSGVLLTILYMIFVPTPSVS